MRWDCGLLAKNPRQSPIARYLLNDPPRSHAWPKHIQQEACAFFHTPGISEGWLQHNLGLNCNIISFIKASLRRRHPEWVDKGRENLMTATYDDAVNYCRRGPRGTWTPFWAMPFLLEDIKNKVGEAEIERIWGSSKQTMRKKDFMYDFFHSGGTFK